METGLNSKLVKLINDGKTILSEIPTKKQMKEGIEYYKNIKKSTPLDDLFQNAKHEVADEIFQSIASDFGVPNKISKRLKGITRKNETYKTKNEIKRFEKFLESEYNRKINSLNIRYLNWDEDLKNFLSKVTIMDNEIVVVTSKKLHQKIIRADKHSKLETKLKHKLASLEEYTIYTVVLNEEVKDYSIGQMSEKVRNLESNLREFILTELSKIHGVNWWKKAIPPDIRKNAEGKKEKSVLLTPKDENIPLIQFIDFSELRKILEKRDNRKVFGDILNPIDVYLMKLKELESIRNKLHHSRELSKKDVDKVVLYYQEFVDVLKLDT